MTRGHRDPFDNSKCPTSVLQIKVLKSINNLSNKKMCFFFLNLERCYHLILSYFQHQSQPEEKNIPQRINTQSGA